MAKFCGICGSKLDEINGLCPVCNCSEKTVSVDYSTDEINSKPTTVAESACCSNENISSFDLQSSTTETNYSVPEKSKKNSVFQTVICTVLAFCLFITAFLSLLLFDIRNTLREDNADKLLNNFSITSAINEFDMDPAGYRYDFYDFLYNDMERFDVSDKDLDSFIIESPARDSIVDLISEFSEEFFEDGKAKLKIKKTDIVNTLEDCDDYFEEEYDIRPEKNHYNKVANWILVDGDITVVDTSDYGSESNLIRLAFSYVSIIILLLLCVVIIFAMFKNNYKKALVGVGVVFIIIGSIFLIPSIIPLLNDLYTSSVIILIISNFFAANWVPALIIFVLGVSLLISKRIIKIFSSKNHV